MSDAPLGPLFELLARRVAQGAAQGPPADGLEPRG